MLTNPTGKHLEGTIFSLATLNCYIKRIDTNKVKICPVALPNISAFVKAPQQKTGAPRPPVSFWLVVLVPTPLRNGAGKITNRNYVGDIAQERPPAVVTVMTADLAPTWVWSRHFRPATVGPNEAQLAV